MNHDELSKKLALEKLVETGIGFVSPKTFDEIKKMVVPEQRVCGGDPRFVSEFVYHGIRLVENPFIPDGEIYPFQPWDLRPKKKEYLL